MTVAEYKKTKPSLGRGLSALLGENVPDVASDNSTEIAHIAVSLMRPGQYQPRQYFDDEKLDSLIDSVREKGIIQPLIVRPITTEFGKKIFEIIAGERRWRAAKTLELETIPAIIREIPDQEALEIAIIENIQRDDLTPIEEAEAYQRLADEFSYTQEQLARSIGKSRSHVANTLRLNQLPEETKKLIHEGKLTAGHARTLLTAANPEMLTQEIIDKKLNVREAEKLAKHSTPTMDLPPSTTEIEIQQLQQHISDLLKIPAQLKINKNGAILTVNFKSFEEIDDFITKIQW